MKQKRYRKEKKIHEFKPDNNAICGGGGCSRHVWRCSHAGGLFSDLLLDSAALCGGLVQAAPCGLVAGQYRPKHVLVSIT